MTIKNSIKIRLSRFGRRNQPVYNIVVTNLRSSRDSFPIEVLGTYNPIPIILTPDEKKANIKPYKHVELDFDRTKYWIGLGVDLSSRVSWLLKKVNLIPEDWDTVNIKSEENNKIIEDVKIIYEPKIEIYRKRT